MELQITQTSHTKSVADRRMDGQSGPITRSALAKVTQVIISKGKRGMERTKRLILKKSQLTTTNALQIT